MSVDKDYQVFRGVLDELTVADMLRRIEKLEKEVALLNEKLERTNSASSHVSPGVRSIPMGPVNLEKRLEKIIETGERNFQKFLEVERKEREIFGPSPFEDLVGEKKECDLVRQFREEGWFDKVVEVDQGTAEERAPEEQEGFVEHLQEVLLKTGSEAYRRSLAAGVPVTVVEDGWVVKHYPNGAKEYIKRIKSSSEET